MASGSGVSVAQGDPLDAAASLRLLLDTLPQAYCEIEVLFHGSRPMDYRFLLVNAQFERHTGLAGVVGRSMRAMVPDHDAHWYEIYGEVARTGVTADFLQPAEAMGRWYEVRAFRIGGEGSRRVGVLFTDVTAREQSRARERDSEMRASLAVAIAQLGTFRVDPPQGRVFFDARMAEQWGLPAEPGSFTMDELIARIHPDDREHILATAASSLDPRQAVRYEVDYRVVWPDGSEHWVYANGQPQVEGEGEARRVVAVIGTTRDITRRKQTEAQLRESERRLGIELAAAKTLQHLSSRLIIGEQPDQIFRDVLAAACALMGSDGASLQRYDPDTGNLALVAHRGLHPESARHWQSVAAGDACACAEALVRAQRVVVDDTEATYAEDVEGLLAFRLSGLRSVQSTPLASRSGQPLGMLSTQWRESRAAAQMDFSLFDVLARQVADLFERLSADQSLRESQARLREADLRKDEFLATLAHELRNPLATIRTAVDLMGRGGAAVDAGGLQSMLQRQVEHMVRLINDLLEVSRISRGVIDLDRQPLDLCTVVRETVDAAGPEFDRAGLSLRLHGCEGPLSLEGDRVRLAQVVGNLVNNALRYTDPGGRVDVTVSKDQGIARVAVSDTGIGIEAEKLPGLFSMFRQIDRRDVRSQGGLGIGLSLAQRLAQMHGGRVLAESAGLGHGSRFTLELPLAPGLAPPAAAAPDAARGVTPRCRVLVVDDNRDAADSTAMLLRAAGAQVQVAYDGVGALEVMARWRPDVAFLDLGMPGMDGIEVARRIRAQAEFADVRLVALTGWGQGDDVARTRAHGFDGHLVKPAAMEDLLGSLRDLATDDA
jgi:signal transduction histidine kinase/PAS domain-containing protein/ActR/RegA family two-component response regulator